MRQANEEQITITQEDLDEAIAANTTQDELAITPELINLSGPITEKTCNKVIKHLLLIDSEYPEIPQVSLIINSGGGDMTAALALISVMRASRIDVNTVAIGTCASAALMIAMAGTKRYVDKYCQVMSHMFSTGLGVMSKPSSINDFNNSVKLTKHVMLQHYIDCTGQTKEFIKKNMLHKNKDIYLLAEDAIEFHMFDGLYDDYNLIHSSERENQVQDAAADSQI